MKKIRLTSLGKDPFLLWFAVLAVILGILMPLLSQSYAITWDEWMDSNYGLLILKYILSGGENTSYTGFWHGYLYSGFFFVLLGLAQGLLSGSVYHYIFDVLPQTDSFFRFYQLSHLLNSVFGFYFFFFTGLCAKEIKNWRLSCLVLILMALSPRIFGHAMNNPKDIPFAATHMASLFFMIRCLKQMPRPSIQNMLLLALFMGLAIGCRVGGVILIGHLWFLGWVFYFHSRWIKKIPVPWLPWFGRLLVISLYAYAIGLFFWPYGQLNPFLNGFRALAQLSNFRFDAGQTLVQGHFYPVIRLPWSYLPSWIAVTTPLVVLVGWLLFCVVYPFSKKKSDGRFIFFLVWTSFFPIGAVILRHSVVYNDWRHLYFTYGPLILLAALGWDALLDFAASKKIRIGGVFIFMLLAALPLGWMIRNHPYQAIYFNELIGGVKGAAGNYEIDYWSNTMRTAAEWLADYHNRRWPNAPAVIKAEGYPMSTYAIFREKLGSRYVPFYYPDRHLQSRRLRFLHLYYKKIMPTASGWDYEISLLQLQTREELQAGKWPPSENVLFEVKVDGMPVCIVTKNPDSSLFKKNLPA